jgi:plastocyanin/FtsP/CotA-like multicopper oxidase with cupredoxin domain
MATVDIWIQLESHAWDVCPSLPVDRRRSAGALAVGPLRQVYLNSPVTGATRVATVHRPISGDALILRRYAEWWGTPDDRKVNPWDLNEPDPTDSGTMGTIPGATIECNVGDTVRVHFRNFDRRRIPGPPWQRTDLLPVAERAHSLHAHGVSFPAKYDGAYPLSPPDTDQPIGAMERTLWDGVGVKGPFKQGDRVPAGATFTYTWYAQGPASAGVWAYHDHSIADMENISRGALGVIVVHNPLDTDGEVDITPERLPDGSWTGSPLIPKSIPVHDGSIGVLDYALVGLGGTPGHPGGVPKPTLELGHVHIELTSDMGYVKSLSIGTYRQPPDQAQCLLVFHELEGAGMCINGRQYLGNAPTIVAGAGTRLRFGIVGMGDAFHTFHIHGHRWVVLGPSGTSPTAIEQSAQTEPTTPFEDTKVFGPGASFAFTLPEGESLFRPDPPFGEWHMHCHVPMHMMNGMTGSLLIVRGGELAMPLPEGQAPPPPPQPPDVPRAPKTFDVHITAKDFKPAQVFILPGDTVRWVNDDVDVKGDPQWYHIHGPKMLDGSPVTNNMLSPGQDCSRTFTTTGFYAYRCFYHAHNVGDIMPPTVVVMEHEIHVTGDGSAVAPPATPGGGPTPPPAGGGSAATMHDVSISAIGFSPSSVTIMSGESVRWTNHDSTPHTATVDDHSWTSPTLAAGKTFFKTFTSKGTIGYHCHIHPDMTGTIVVS